MTPRSDIRPGDRITFAGDDGERTSRRVDGVSPAGVWVWYRGGPHLVDQGRIKSVWLCAKNSK